MTPSPRSRGRPPAARRLAAVVGTAAAALFGCQGPPLEAETVSRDVFVATYVDLRRTALEKGGGPLEGADRERILAEHGVTEDELLRFADVHGGDPAYMRSVWDAVEGLLGDSVPPPPALDVQGDG